MSTISYPDGQGASISTGRIEIDQQMGGGIPRGTLTLVEGKRGTGKSVLCQHLAHSALRSGSKVAFYCSEMTSPGLISQMSSLGLEAVDFFLLDQLRVFRLDRPQDPLSSSHDLDKLLRHVEVLSSEFDLVLLDSLADLMGSSPVETVHRFLARFYEMCQGGLTAVITLDPRGFSSAAGRLVEEWCDIHLHLRMQTVMVPRVVKTIEVRKTNRDAGGYAADVTFDVYPGRGMGIVWARKPE